MQVALELLVCLELLDSKESKECPVFLVLLACKVQLDLLVFLERQDKLALLVCNVITSSEEMPRGNCLHTHCNTKAIAMTMSYVQSVRIAGIWWPDWSQWCIWISWNSWFEWFARNTWSQWSNWFV
jgi:hypothetical protein